MVDYDSDREHEYQNVSLADFHGLNHYFYHQTTQFFASEQFAHVGDIEDLTETRSHPSQRSCVRILVEPGATTHVAVYENPAAGILRVFQLMIRQRYVELVTEFSDGEFVITTNNEFRETNPHVDKHVEQTPSLRVLLRVHRERVQNYLEDYPTAQIRTLSTLTEVLEAQQRQRYLKPQPATDRLRRRSRKLARTGSHMLQELYDRRAGFAAVVTWILLGLALGLTMNSSAIRRYEKDRQLTRKQYEQAYEEHKAQATSSPVYSFIMAGIVVGVFFAVYEVVRLGLKTGLARVLKGVIRRPSQPLTSSFARHAAIGKIMVIVALIPVLGYFSARHNQQDSQLTREEYMARFEEHQEEVSRPPGEQPLVAYVLISGLLLGLYNFGGGATAGVGALVTGGGIPIGMHVFVVTFGSLVIGITSFATWPDGEIRWIIIPAIIVFIFLLGGFLHLVPVPCRECGGKAYCISGKRITFKCRQCQHVNNDP